MQLNYLIEKAFLLNVTEPEIQNFKKFFELQSEHQDLKLGAAIFRYMDDLDTKSSALLTHVSMLIAAVSIMLSVYDDEISRSFLLIEAAAYVYIATGLLRCVSIINPHNTDLESYREDTLREVVIRVSVYRKARTFTIFVTVAFFLSILLKPVF
tara:strand:+ start:26986 stop:27447 length:462 start_codon:yes stop_codon:yes gene_type:complete